MNNPPEGFLDGPPAASRIDRATATPSFGLRIGYLPVQNLLIPMMEEGPIVGGDSCFPIYRLTETHRIRAAGGAPVRKEDIGLSCTEAGSPPAASILRPSRLR